MSLLTPEDKFLYTVGRELKAARDKAIGSIPRHALALCFKVRWLELGRPCHLGARWGARMWALAFAVARVHVCVHP